MIRHRTVAVRAARTTRSLVAPWMLLACSQTEAQSPPSPGVSGLPAPSGGQCDVFQCSVDLRSIVRQCDGVVVETCPPDQGCGNGVCVDACAAAAAAQSSLGCDFLTQPPLTYPVLDGATVYDRSCFAAYVSSVWPTATTLSVEFQGVSLPLDGAVFSILAGTSQLTPHAGPILPGESVVVFLSDGGPDEAEFAVLCPLPSKPLILAARQRRTQRRAGRGYSLRIAADHPVAVSTIYPFGGATSVIPSAATLFPVPTWQKDQIIVNAWSSAVVALTNTVALYPSVQIVAAEDGTDLVVRPVASLVDGEDFTGVPAGATLTYHLSKGEFFQIAQERELTGSFVSANKPIAVFGGHECMYVDRTQQACDTAQQQLPALTQWGAEYAAAPYRPRFVGDAMPYKLVGSADETTLTYDPPLPPPGAPTGLSRGESRTFWTDQPFVVRSQDSDHAFYLAAYMSGIENDRYGHLGDPEFVNVVPAGQYLSAYTFFADPTYAETSLTIVRQTAASGFRDVRLACLGVVGSFQPIGDGGAFEYAQVDLSRHGAIVPNGAGSCGYGRQDLSSDGPFSVTLWGWDFAASYAIPGGTSLRRLTSRTFDEIR